MKINRLTKLLVGLVSSLVGFGETQHLCRPKDLPYLYQQITTPYIEDVSRPMYRLLAFAPAKVTSSYNRSGFVWIEVMKYAFKKLLEALHREGINLNLQLKIYDSCDQIDIATLELLEILLGQKDDNVIGIIGPASSTMTDHFLKFLSFEIYPIISYSATSVRFKNRDQYPGFLRTIPPDNFQARLIVDIVEKYKWSYISIVAEDNEYGRMGLSELKKLFTDHNSTCIAVELIFKRNDTANIQGAIDSIAADKQAKVVIIWASGPATINFLKEAERRRIHEKTFILGESTNVSPRILKDFSPDLIQGVLSIVPYSGIYKDFEMEFGKMKYKKYNHENLWLKFFFEKYTDQRKLNSSKISDYWKLLPQTKNGNVFNEVAAYIQSIKDFILKSGKCTTNDTSKCLQYIVQNREAFCVDYLKRVVFTNLIGEKARFNIDGDINDSQYHVASVQQNNENLTWVTVANWNTKDGLVLTKNFEWSGDQKETPISNCGTDCRPGFTYQSRTRHCCWNCIPCTGNKFKPNIGNEKCRECPKKTYVNKDHTGCKPLTRIMIEFDSTAGRVIVLFASLNISLAVIIMAVFISFRKTPVVLSSQITISFIQLTFLMALNIPTFLIFGQISNEKCITSGIFMPLCFVMAITPTLIKTQRLVKVFNSKTPQSLKHDNKNDFLKLTSLAAVQGIIVVLFIIFKGTDLKSRIVNLKNFEESYSCDVRVLIYIEIALAFLIFITVSIASFKAREIPTNYNETRVIAYGTFLCTVIIISLIFLSKSIRNDINRTVGITFTFLLLDFVLLAFMYCPKMWIILFRPQLNTHQHFASQRIKSLGKQFEMILQRQHGDNDSATSTPICVCRAGKINYIDIKCEASPITGGKRDSHCGISIDSTT
ncbi:extracellular calcium-sensing receptor-like [Clytia hemisphaerica]|uniref:extracellular calcium-sensing receptor-like n=1 Tax=Clytia hemisphaerica TaxID=252671 RepID=UPI0034D73D3A